MREEKVTITLLEWLESSGWQIVCYDYPQSGTGMLFHPNSDRIRNEKNKGAVIPDIIAARESVALYFENKDRFYAPDFKKLKEIKKIGAYSDSLMKVLQSFGVTQIFYGIGIPDIANHVNKSLEHIQGLDFLVAVCSDQSVRIHFDANRLFDSDQACAP